MKKKLTNMLMLSAALSLSSVCVNAQTWNLTGNPAATNTNLLGPTAPGVNLRIFTGGTAVANERMRILGSNGNVGIGTIAPTTKLHVVGTSRLQGSTTIVGATTVTGTQTISGNLGIATLTPTHAKLEISGSVGSTVAMFGADKAGVSISSNNPEVGLNYYYNGATRTIQAGYGANMGMHPSSGDVYIGNFNGNQSTSAFGTITGYQQRITIKQNGNVGIGTTSPLLKLHVAGASYLANNTLVDPDNYSTSVLAGSIADGGGWSVASGIGGRGATAGPSWGLGANSSGLYLGFGNGTSANSMQTALEVHPNRNLILVGNSGGNVGVGTYSPTHAKLEVAGTVGSSAAMFGVGKAGVTLSADNPEVGFNFYYNGGTRTMKAGYGSVVGMFPGNGDVYIGNFNNNQSTSDFGPITGYQQRLTIKQNGNIGIGTTTPSYKLDVCGSIRAKEVRVETGWCDYVFADGYQLPSLNEVEAFIKTNKHLPDVTPGNIIETEGLEVGKVSAQMIKKIEELTLYAIDQAKAINNLKTQNDTLVEQVKMLIDKGGN